METEDTVVKREPQRIFKASYAFNTVTERDEFEILAMAAPTLKAQNEKNKAEIERSNELSVHAVALAIVQDTTIFDLKAQRLKLFELLSEILSTEAGGTINFAFGLDFIVECRAAISETIADLASKK